MAKISRFEDLDIWQRAFKLSNLIDEITANGTFASNFELKDQIRRSSGSIMDNIAEGFERGGNVEFINFLIIAKGSAGEVRSQLYRAKYRSHISDAQFQEIYVFSEELSKHISNFISYLKNSELKGFNRRKD